MDATAWRPTHALPRTHEWAGNSSQLLIQQLTRKQDVNRVYLSDISNGRSQKLLSETTDSWAEYVDDVKFLDNGKSFTWLSERSDTVIFTVLNVIPAR